MNEVIDLRTRTVGDSAISRVASTESGVGQLAAPAGSSTSDQVAEICRRLSFLRQTRDIRSVLVTSTVPRQGKTTVALALSAALARPLAKPIGPVKVLPNAATARYGSSVLLVDGDLRNAGVARMLGQSALLPGLAEGIEHDRELMPLVRYVPHMNIQWLPAGCPSKVDPSSLLADHGLKVRMHDLAMQFDWMVVDAPSVQSDECNLLAVATDVVVMVVRPDHISHQHLRESLSKLDPSFLAGVIFNHEERARPERRVSNFFANPAFAR